jgi:hypothetical protein
MLHQAVVEGNAYFAQQVQGILKEGCATGEADLKKSGTRNAGCQ